MKKTRWAQGTMVASTFLVATSFPVVASIAGTMDSVVLTVLRFALAALLFLPIVALRHRREVLPTWRSLVRYAVLSAPLVGFFFAMFESLRTTTAVNTGALFTLAPIFAALFALGLLGERLGGRRLLALVVGMVGSVWVVFRGQPSHLMGLDLALGDGFFLAGTASLGLYTVLIKRLRRGEPMAVMTFWTLVTGSGWLLVLGWDELAAVRWSEVEPRVLGAISYLALFTTLITFLITQMAITVIGATRAMAYTYLNPALVAILAWALGGEAIGLTSLPGVGLTLGAMVVLQRGSPASPVSASRPDQSCRPRYA
jgi:drug/metabolite transporter (DMT)-like permease